MTDLLIAPEAASTGRVYTVDEFEALLALPRYRDRRLELVEGRIEEKPMPTEVHGLLAGLLPTELNLYFRVNPIGRVVVEVRSRSPHDSVNSRQPDISIYTDVDRPLVWRGAVPRLPDIAVEIKSPDDSLVKLRAKAQYYLANGVKIVWLIYAEKRLIEVYTADDEVEILLMGDTLTGGDVLPGFSLPLAQLFAAL